MLRPSVLAACLSLPTLCHAQGAGPAGFAEPARATASADLAIDDRGAVHMAWIHYEPSAAGGAAAYAACDAPCDPSGTTPVTLLAAARAVQVAVTPQGQPRLLIETDSIRISGGVDFHYAACDSGCDSVANWQSALIATSWDTTISSFLDHDRARRSFAVGSDGIPRFVYSDRNYQVEPDHYGTYYMSCEADCLTAQNWIESDLAFHTTYDTEIFTAPALALGSDNQPWIASGIIAFDREGHDAPDGLYVLTCPGGTFKPCTNGGGWQRFRVMDHGVGSYPSPGWDIGVDGDGRPQIALFAGADMEEAGLDHTLLRLWCSDTTCQSDAAWSGQVIATEGHGEAPAIAVTPDGRPRIAFLSAGGGLAWAVCESDCAGDGPGWRLGMVEDVAALAATRPTALPFTCDGEVWSPLGPQIALGQDGELVTAQTTSVQARCLYQAFGEPEITYEFHEIWRGARFAHLPEAVSARQSPGTSEGHAMFLERSIAVPAPASLVWSVTADVESWPVWMPTIAAVEALQDGSMAKGHRYSLQQPMQRAVVWEVTEYEPGAAFEWRSAGDGVQFIGRHAVEPDTAGMTLATTSLRVTGRMPALLRPLFAGVLWVECRSLAKRCAALSRRRGI